MILCILMSPAALQRTGGRRDCTAWTELPPGGMNRYGSEGPDNAERRAAARAQEEEQKKTLKILLKMWELEAGGEKKLTKSQIKKILDEAEEDTKKGKKLYEAFTKEEGNQSDPEESGEDEEEKKKKKDEKKKKLAKEAKAKNQETKEHIQIENVYNVTPLERPPAKPEDTGIYLCKNEEEARELIQVTKADTQKGDLHIAMLGQPSDVLMAVVKAHNVKPEYFQLQITKKEKEEDEKGHRMSEMATSGQ